MAPETWNIAIRIVVIILAVALIILLVAYYTRTIPLNTHDTKSPQCSNKENFEVPKRETFRPVTQENPIIRQENMKKSVTFQDMSSGMQQPTTLPQPAQPPQSQQQEKNIPQPSEYGGNEDYFAVDFASSIDSRPNNPNESFPQDKVKVEDLLPKDAANSKWAQVVPAGQGDVKDQNFLTAGFHIGIDTIGQSHKNSNLQIRPEFPNPKIAVGPWMNSSIEPDQYRKHCDLDM